MVSFHKLKYEDTVCFQSQEKKNIQRAPKVVIVYFSY